MIINPSGMKISEGSDIFNHKDMWADNFELIDGKFNILSNLTIDVNDFSSYVVGNDWSNAFDQAVSKARLLGRKLFVPSGTYQISRPIDISGIVLVGDEGGAYANPLNGTVITCLTKDFSALKQVTHAVNDLTYSVRHITITDAFIGLETNYAVNCEFDNVTLLRCDLGVKHGDSTILGSLFCSFTNVYTKDCNKGIDINGSSWANNNVFTNCFFEGDTYGATLNCNGGIGAVNNVFIACEIASSGGRGISLTNAKNTSFINCYFECLGNAIRFINATATTLLQPMLGSLKNTNTLGDTAFFHLESTASITLIGGTDYLVSGTDTTGLYQFSSPALTNMQNVKVINDIRHLSMIVPFHATATNNQGIIVRANDGFNWQITVNTTTGAVSATKLV
jgi:hypothetical protein